ncbi:DMT family transporter [Planctomycetes bacterium K23_9]|uniref:Putative DMT superfamily transporter inner membrane protein n=1 Tax=Stieleria marina TaxID=1930275 RepID=A0A517P0D9_9BACT|nr:putative DMT superfamily transporter inner membrane protein [Planctomycetes bacterium K23_9]
MTTKLANGLLLAVGAIWGLAFVAQQSAMDDMPAMLFIALRFFLAAAVVAPMAIYERARIADPDTAARSHHFVVLGIVFFLGMSTQQIGLLGTTVTNAGFLTTLYVVIVPVLLFVVCRQRQSVAVWMSAFVSLIGVYLLSGGDFSRITWGDWMVVLCAFCWAIHVILVGRFAKQTNRPVSLAAKQFFVCGCCGTIAHLVSESLGWTDSTFSVSMLLAVLPEIAYAGILAGGLGFTLQIVAQRHTSSSVAAILMGTESLFAAVFGAVFVGDRLTPAGYFGCALIFAAVITVELLPVKKFGMSQGPTVRQPRQD